MRAKELLLEYDRNITLQNWGAKLYSAFLKDPSFRNSKYTKDQALTTIIRYLEEADPTPNKQYVQTIAKWHCIGKFYMEDAVSRSKDASIKFEQLKRKNKLEIK
jgi:hypothetical protein